ncbi:MAG: hypothetical protein HQK55_05215 [Deltaproteobacteria bacterium]|nr:hypothetical protein [Deltaproteobacteria bacterium]
MTRYEVEAILNRGSEEIIKAILTVAEKAEKYDQLISPPDPATSSGGIPAYKQENHRDRKKKPGQKKCT